MSGTIKSILELNSASSNFKSDYSQFLDSSSKKLKVWINKCLGSNSEASITSITLGSGFAPLKDEIRKFGEITFSELGLPASSAQGHEGTFIAGSLNEKPIILQAGRLHHYEGHPGFIVALPARLQSLAGIKTFIITNAAGGLDPNFKVGDFVLLTGNDASLSPSPSVGLHGSLIGSQFYSTTDPYDVKLQDKFFEAAKKCNLSSIIHSGSYKYMPGPRYEERAEISQLFLTRMNMLSHPDTKIYALSAVGMSTVPEVHALCQLKTLPEFESIRILGISLITNLCAGIGDSSLNHEEVLAAGKESGERIIRLFKEFMGILIPSA